MTMVPSQNLITTTPKHHHRPSIHQQQEQDLQNRLLLLLQRGHLYGGGDCREEEEEEEDPYSLYLSNNYSMSQPGGNGNGNGNEYCSAESDVVNNIPPPAETEKQNSSQQVEEAAASSNNNNHNSSKDEEDQDGDDVEATWLQLSIGGGGSHRNKAPSPAPPLRPSSSSSMYLEQYQLTGRSTSPANSYYRSHYPLHNWPLFNLPSTSSSPFFHHPPPSMVPADFRVVDPPPRRPHSGVWFALRASQNQTKEPFLPQVSKSFLRIKDGRMTVRLLIKYLVNKLRLESELEVVITCRGQQVVPLMTLQQVRDHIWGPNLSLRQDSSTTPTDHLMLLLYSRTP